MTLVQRNLKVASRFLLQATRNAGWAPPHEYQPAHNVCNVMTLTFYIWSELTKEIWFP